MTTFADAFRGISGTTSIGDVDPIVATLAERARAVEERRLRRKLERATLGCCPCGEVAGEAECPWCDGGLPLGLRDAGAAMRRRDGAKGTIDPAEVIKALAAAKIAEDLCATNGEPRNRFERRRARSRRWRG